MQNSPEQIHAMADVVKMTPAGAYIGVTLAGVSIADWVTILTGVYVGLQLILLIPKYVEAWHKWRQSKRG
jgi:hypothetical protein